MDIIYFIFCYFIILDFRDFILYILLLDCILIVTESLQYM